MKILQQRRAAPPGARLAPVVDNRNKFWRKNSWRHERHSKFRILVYEAIFKPNLLQSEVVKGGQLLSKNSSEIVLK